MHIGLIGLLVYGILVIAALAVFAGQSPNKSRNLLIILAIAILMLLAYLLYVGMWGFWWHGPMMWHMYWPR